MVNPTEQESVPNYEIERKWLVTYIPPEIDLANTSPQRIIQGYLTDDEGKIIRYRQRDVRRYKTHKLSTDHPSKRVEDEVEITEEEFLDKWPYTEGRRIDKFRYRIPHEGYTIELDVFLGDNLAKMMAEVEFVTTEEADAFVAPSWLGPEVTEDGRFGNCDIAEFGFPEAV